jgi:hypothetical protein
MSNIYPTQEMIAEWYEEWCDQALGENPVSLEKFIAYKAVDWATHV